MKKIAVLLTVFNRKTVTINGLRSLRKAIESVSVEACEFYVYMTDDGCTDGTTEAVLSEFPWVKVVQGNGDLYWGGGMRAAWEAAVKCRMDYDYYLWFNDDTILTHNAIEVLLKHSKNVNDDSIIVGATSDTKSHNIITYSGYRNNKERIVPNGELQRCEYFNGNIVLIPQKVYSLIGMNDSVFSHSIGDFDYGLRARRNGILSYVASTIIGYCDRHNTMPTWCNPCCSLGERWRSFKSPLGAAPLEYFIFDYRYKGVVRAILGLITTFAVFLFPRFFVYKLRNNPMYYNNSSK